jgi:hypothetical protein
MQALCVDLEIDIQRLPLHLVLFRRTFARRYASNKKVT